MKLIGLAGRARSGKDTVAEYLYKKHAFCPMAFAAPLKAMLEVIGIDCNDATKKEVIDPRFGKSPRQIMQYLGTEWMRNCIHPDGWVRIAAYRVQKYRQLTQTLSADTLVFSDVRFENEANWIRSEGGQIWHLWREDVPEISPHVSELPLPIESGDQILINNGTLAELYEEVEECLSCV